MADFTITVDDAEVQAKLSAFAERVDNPRAGLTAIGEGIVERTKRRFETSKGPDGTPWKPNSVVTLALFSGHLAGQKSKVKKDGSLNAAGEQALANKKPLIGESRDLSRQLYIQVGDMTLTVTSTPVYAAIQQFGGQAGRGRKVTIPERPFLPIHKDGTLYPSDQADIIDELNEYLLGDLAV
ncbi:phage virion morphogenesis protein [Rhodoferax sp. BLA1]|uniref:phage virion morphogenesis protein n=1 Tax=Rhodoferax sp. BLA1 TaxID=2576062 RepID=UPI0015D3C52F|nr:phage virion morphogenesis protein [Rhodoferax sp. BLA1]